MGSPGNAKVTPSEILEQNENHGSSQISLDKIQTLLRSKDDTQRFVGLALLQSALSSSAELRADHDAIQALWTSISPKFLDRLLRTGAKSSTINADAKNMLELAVAVIEAFVQLLPAEICGHARAFQRIPKLVEAILYSVGETTLQISELLLALVKSSAGARCFLEVEDLDPLIEIAPKCPAILQIFRYAWQFAAQDQENHIKLRDMIDTTMLKLTSSFTGTDGVTLLQFVAIWLREAELTLPSNDPPWISRIVAFVRKLALGRPTPEARDAYTNVTATLLQVHPSIATTLIFPVERNQEKPFTYHFINLILIDIRSSLPSLLEHINDSTYPAVSCRLSSAFDVICIFTGYLIRCLEDETLETLIISPDGLLKLRKGISETISLTLEYLRDRWDASVAGAMGLHKDARLGGTTTSMGSRHALTWDSAKYSSDGDPLVLSAVRASAVWLREDENDLLRKEATGLIDMFLELYAPPSNVRLDFRSPILVAFEALLTLDRGRIIFLQNSGWQILTGDLMETWATSPNSLLIQNANRGIEIVRVLLSVVEGEQTGTTEEWLDILTAVGSGQLPDREEFYQVLEFRVAILQLSATILANANGGMRKRYNHTISAISGIVHGLQQLCNHHENLRADLIDVLDTLDSF